MPCAPSSSSAPSTRRRKGIPHKSPSRTLPYPAASSARPSPSSSSSPAHTGTTINVSALLRALLREGDLHLDNKRFSPRLSEQNSKLQLRQKKERDTLPPVEEGYGRGKRSASAGVSPSFGAEYELGLDYVGTAVPRGRLTGARRGKGDGQERLGVAAAGAATRGRKGMTGRRAASTDSSSASSSSSSRNPYHAPYIPSAHDFLAVPGTASTSRMARALSVGVPASTTTATGAAYHRPYETPVPSPLARSFSSNGGVLEERIARSRTPSAGMAVAA
ncbi:hypothetical protein JCM21900_000846 [Sporobolomyces salmonicolor]